MTNNVMKKGTMEMKDFWKITIALLLLICGYTTSLIVLMNIIGRSM